ncbi:MAG: PEGA domain-containing protein [Acidobacteriia bacterium]|nr:PEGA domain-containing protein [Terriglobia bacterium]
MGHWGEKLMRGTFQTAVLLGLLGLCAHGAQAQAVAETAVVTSGSSMAANSATTPPLMLASPAKPSPSPHLMTRTGPPREEVNRKDFEENAGEKAGKLLLRSVPSGAEIFVNDLLVGKTPLLMVLAPGKYKIDMRGPRQESGHRTVGVMPKETETVVIDLNQRYPASISIR